MKMWKRGTDWVSFQHAVFNKLLESVRKTCIGKDHCFASIRNYKEFRERVPVRDYEALRPYIERMVAGEPDVLWKGKPQYLAKTSGTTSGVKYIPITHTSMPHHIKAARNRSEEHTSELQSLMRISYAVFCLKKQTNYKYK